MADEVSNIGVKLTLDASGFTGPLGGATEALNKFQTQAQRAGSGVASTRAGGGAKGATSTPVGVDVTLSVSAAQISALRTQIARGLGNIPITITPTFAKSGNFSLPNILGSMLSMQYGTPKAQAVREATQFAERFVGQTLPQKAMGGPVSANRPYIVGERRPEVFVPRVSGTVVPSVREFYRQQERIRHQEAEMAALAYQQQRQHQRQMDEIERQLAQAQHRHGGGSARHMLGGSSRVTSTALIRRGSGIPGTRSWMTPRELDRIEQIEGQAFNRGSAFPAISRFADDPFRDFDQQDVVAMAQHIRAMSRTLSFPQAPRGYSSDPTGHIMRSIYGLYGRSHPDAASGWAKSVYGHSSVETLGRGMREMERDLDRMGRRGQLSAANNPFGFFHATTDINSVLKRGLMSSNELQADPTIGFREGLGGGSDKVSLTWSLKRARQIAATLRMAGRVARGEADPRQVANWFLGRIDRNLTATNREQAQDRLKNALAQTAGMPFSQTAHEHLDSDPEVKLRYLIDRIQRRHGNDQSWEAFKALDYHTFNDSDSPAERRGVFFVGVDAKRAREFKAEDIGIVQAAMRRPRRGEQGVLRDTAWSDWPAHGIIPGEYEMRIPPKLLTIIGRRSRGGYAQQGRRRVTGTSVSGLPIYAGDDFGIYGATDIGGRLVGPRVNRDFYGPPIGADVLHPSVGYMMENNPSDPAVRQVWSRLMDPRREGMGGPFSPFDRPIRKNAMGGLVHAMAGRAKAVAPTYLGVGNRDQAVANYIRYSEMATGNPLSVFGGNIWYHGRRRAALEEAKKQGWLDTSSFTAMRRSAERILAVPSVASPGINDELAFRWSGAILNAIQQIGPPPGGQEEAWVRNLQKSVPGLPVGYGYNNFAKAAAVASGYQWPPSFGVSPKVEPFYHAVRGKEGNLVADSHHLLAGGYDPQGAASKVNKIVRQGLVVGSNPTPLRAEMLSASEEVFGMYSHIWPSISRWQAAIWGEHFPHSLKPQPIEAAYTNLIIPKGFRNQAPPGWKIEPSGLLVKRAGGGYVSSVFQTAADWAKDPFMAIMAAAYAQQQQGHRAQGGPTDRGLYIVGEIGPELFVPNTMRNLIPKKVMDQIPHARGGMRVIGQKPNSLFAPEQDGIIVPNRLMNLVPHAAIGREIGRDDPRYPEAMAALEGGTRRTPPVEQYTQIAGMLRAVLTENIEVRAADRAARAADRAAARTARDAEVAAEVTRLRSETAAAATAAATGAPVAGAGFIAGAAVGAGHTAPPAGGLPPDTTRAITDADIAERAARSFVAAGSPIIGGRVEGLGGIWYDVPADLLSLGVPAPGAGGTTPPAGAAARPGGRVSDAELARTVSAGGAGALAAAHATALRGGAVAEDPYAELGKAASARARDMGRHREGAAARMDEEFQTEKIRRAGAGQLMGGRTALGAVANTMSFLFGGRQQYTQAQVRAREAEIAYNRVASHSGFIIDRNTDMLADLNSTEEKRTANLPKIAELTAEVAVHEEKLAKARDLRLEAEKAAEPSTGGVLRNLGVIIGSTKLYSAAMGAAEMVIDQALIPATQKWLDQMQGFVATSQRVTTALADQTRANGGNAKAAMAALAVQSGMSSATFDWSASILDATVAAKAGSKAYSDYSDIFRATLGAGRAPQGLFGGYGGIGGGNLFAEQLGGGPGLLEQTVNNIQAARGRGTGPDIGGILGGAAVGGGIGFGAGSILPFFGNIAGLVAGSIIGGLSAASYQVANPNTNLGALTGTPGASESRLLSDINSAMGRAAGREGEGAYRLKYIGAEAKDLYKDQGLPKEVEQISSQGYAFVDSVGNIVNGFDAVTAATEQYAKGLVIPDIAVWTKTVERQLNVKFQQIDIQGAINRNFLIPMQFAMQRLAAPPMAPGAGVIPGAGLSSAQMAGLGLSGGGITDIAGFLSGAPSAGGLGMNPALASTAAGWVADTKALQDKADQNMRNMITSGKEKILAAPGSAAGLFGAGGGGVPGGVGVEQAGELGTGRTVGGTNRGIGADIQSTIADWVGATGDMLLGPDLAGGVGAVIGGIVSPGGDPTGARKYTGPGGPAVIAGQVGTGAGMTGTTPPLQPTGRYGPYEQGVGPTGRYGPYEQGQGTPPTGPYGPYEAGTTGTINPTTPPLTPTGPYGPYEPGGGVQSQTDLSTATAANTKTNQAAADEYERLMNSAQDASGQIRTLQNSIAALSADVNAAQWKETSRLAERGLSDLRGIIAGASGKKGGSVLGNLEGQLYAIGRASQKLDLELQRRSIATAEALAGFQAPGQTGEERYQNQKEAQIQAAIARKKLGFAQSAYDISGEAWQIQAQRNLEDAQIAWDNAKKAHDAENAIQIANGKIAALNVTMAQDLQTADSLLNDAMSKAQLGINAVADYASTFGGDIVDLSTTMKAQNDLLGASSSGVAQFLTAIGFTFTKNKTGGTTVTPPTYSSGGAGSGFSVVGGTEGGGDTTGYVAGPGRQTVASITAGVSGGAGGFRYNTSRPFTGADNSALGSSKHSGIDLVAKEGTPVHSLTTGTVTYAQNENSDRKAAARAFMIGGGNGVAVEDSRGTFNYAHLSKFFVRKNQHVMAGEVIGEVGHSSGIGLTMHPHLHLGRKEGGKWIDPLTATLPGMSRGAQATGFIGNVGQATRMTVGEAGTETVAILRNPRMSMMGGGGFGSGGSPINLTVNLNGTVVRDERDIHELARCVASEVERILGRKGQLLGLRGPSV